jgi:hypothetical protein
LSRGYVNKKRAEVLVVQCGTLPSAWLPSENRENRGHDTVFSSPEPDPQTCTGKTVSCPRFLKKMVAVEEKLPIFVKRNKIE